MSAHGTTSAPGPTSYGYQMAPAAAEFVSSPISSARTAVSNPFSAKRIAEVKPETPAPTMATLRFISTGPHPNLLPQGEGTADMCKVIQPVITVRRISSPCGKGQG